MYSGKDAREPEWSSIRLEQAISDSNTDGNTTQELVLDPKGFPLRPQPSKDPNGKKNRVLLDDFLI